MSGPETGAFQAPAASTGAAPLPLRVLAAVPLLLAAWIVLQFTRYVPKLAESYESLRVDLPGLTQMALQAGQVLHPVWPVVPAGGVALLALHFIRGRSSSSVRRLACVWFLVFSASFLLFVAGPQLPMLKVQAVLRKK
jgi:hypothetical protein